MSLSSLADVQMRMIAKATPDPSVMDAVDVEVRDATHRCFSTSAIVSYVCVTLDDENMLRAGPIWPVDPDLIAIDEIFTIEGIDIAPIRVDLKPNTISLHDLILSNSLSNLHSFLEQLEVLLEFDHRERLGDDPFPNKFFSIVTSSSVKKK